MVTLEALKHTEWVFGVVFLWFAFVDAELTFIWILSLLIGSQIPDFLELFFIRLGIQQKLARKLTHDYIYVFLIWFILPFSLFPEIHYFALAIAIHYSVDLFSGLEPIYIAGLVFGDLTAIIYVTKNHRISIGKRIETWGSKYLVTETENPTPELAWFWVMQLSGTILCGLGIITYLLFP